MTLKFLKVMINNKNLISCLFISNIFMIIKYNNLFKYLIFISLLSQLLALLIDIKKYDQWISLSIKLSLKVYVFLWFFINIYASPWYICVPKKLESIKQLYENLYFWIDNLIGKLACFVLFRPTRSEGLLSLPCRVRAPCVVCRASFPGRPP